MEIFNRLMKKLDEIEVENEKLKVKLRKGE